MTNRVDNLNKLGVQISLVDILLRNSWILNNSYSP
jgi:hypothetical protein